VLNVTSDHLGLGGVETLEDLAAVKRIVVEVARDCAILNADDEHCLLMADHTEAKRIGYVTMNARHDLVRRHIRAGGAAVVLEEGINGHMITLYDRGSHIPLMWTHLVPCSLEGKALHNVQNAMFAALIAYMLSTKVENIRQGLRTFDTTYFQAPGRMNVFDKHPFKVILDYGHNAAAVRAMAELALRLECGGKRICVLAGPGDRRDEDLLAIATAAAPAFDRFILRRDDHTRGRDADEVPGILRRGLIAEGIADDRIQVIPDEQKAIDAALAQCRRGDLLIVFGDHISRCWKQITKFNSEGSPAPGSPTESSTGMMLDLGATSPDTLGDELGRTLVEDDRGVRIARESED
jgi:cyanophycin synthetase